MTAHRVIGGPHGAANGADVLDRLPELFRQAMSRVALSVHVLTTDGPAGPGGMTASSVCSVSLEPPVLLACVARDARTNDLLRRNPRLCVNTLATDQSDVAKMFAGMHSISYEDRIRGPEVIRRAGFACPLLRGSAASCEGRVLKTTDIGSHRVYFVAVEDVHLGRDDCIPLVWHDRSFTRPEPLPEA